MKLIYGSAQINGWLQKKQILFVLVGALNTFIGLATYPILYYWFSDPYLGYMGVLVLSQLICITFSFVTNKYLVFKTKGGIKKEYVKFFLFHGINMALNFICLPIMVSVWRLNPMIAQTLFSILVIVTSYFWHNYITFRQQKD